MSYPLLKLSNVSRCFSSGELEVVVLDQVSLEIQAGEMVAIVGASGSGKSTLMNILGCLDHPTAGSYQLAGHEVSQLDNDALADLRRERFGFIFQRYHLLPHLTAQDNVSIPAVYSGISLHERRERAYDLLSSLGIDDKILARPNQLSGGEQQRVSIARALMNGGEIILADEPTGALDRKSGAEVMKILKKLHLAGHTIIIVTHDPNIAAQADRTIEISDGQILRDDKHSDSPSVVKAPSDQPIQSGNIWLRQFNETFKMAALAMKENSLRTALTMLGIIIGIASVVSIVAIGEGARNYVLEDIRSIGTGIITINRGKDWSDENSISIQTLRARDLTVLEQESYVDSVSPVTRTRLRIRYQNRDIDGSVAAIGPSFFQVYDMKFKEGVPFTQEDIRLQRQIVIIDQKTAETLFPHQHAIGKVIILGNIPMIVSGITENKNGMFQAFDNVWVPYTTASSRLLGRHFFDSIVIRIKEGQASELVEKRITQLLIQSHGKEDFYTERMDEILKTLESTSQTLTLVLALIGVISLVVGGIGVMNIMLVSVTERTREIGIRMAVGARQSDVLQQFLTEAILVCLIGGAIGITLSYGISGLFSLFVPKWRISLSFSAILLAFLSSSFIGLLFGYLPARNAARLNPIDALVRE